MKKNSSRQRKMQVYMICCFCKDIWRFHCYAHMTVQNDGPYQAQNDGRFSLYDVWDVYVHQLDLREHKQLFMPCVYECYCPNRWKNHYQFCKNHKTLLPICSSRSSKRSRCCLSAETHHDPAHASIEKQIHSIVCCIFKHFSDSV